MDFIQILKDIMNILTEIEKIDQRGKELKRKIIDIILGDENVKNEIILNQTNISFVDNESKFELAIKYYTNNYYHFKDIVNYCIRNNKSIFTVKELYENIKVFKTKPINSMRNILRILREKRLIVEKERIGKEKLYTFNFDFSKFVELLKIKNLLSL